MNALITPGNYNVTNNQDYLFAKLNSVSIYWSWLGLIIVGVLFILFLMGIIGYFGHLNDEVNKDNQKSTQTKYMVDAYQFLHLASSYEDVLNVMGSLSDNDAKILYLDDMKQLMEDLMPNEKTIIQSMTRYEVRTWLKYKALFFNEAK